MCKITAQMPKHILRYCVNTEGTLFSFCPRTGFSSHSYSIDIILFNGYITNAFFVPRIKQRHICVLMAFVIFQF